MISNLRISRHQAIHQIRRNPTLVMIFENEFYVSDLSGARQPRSRSESPRALLSSRLLWEKLVEISCSFKRSPSIESDRSPKHALCVRPLLASRDDSVTVRIDRRDHEVKHRNARCQTDLRLNTVFLQRDRGRLQVFIETMRGRSRAE